jgi:hypothetical protein
MRASNLSLVIATGYCLLWAPGTLAQGPSAQGPSAQGPLAQGPSNISIRSLPMTPGVYTVFWAAPSDVVVDYVNLVGVGSDKFGLQTNTLNIALRTFHGHLAAKHTAVLLTVLKRHRLHVSRMVLIVAPPLLP